MSHYSVPMSQKEPKQIILHTALNDLSNENESGKVAANTLTLWESLTFNNSQS